MPTFKNYATTAGLAVFSLLALAGPGHAQNPTNPPPVNPNAFAPTISPQVLNKLKDIRQAQELSQHLKRMKYVKPLIRLPIPPRPTDLAAGKTLR